MPRFPPIDGSLPLGQIDVLRAGTSRTYHAARRGRLLCNGCDADDLVTMIADADPEEAVERVECDTCERMVREIIAKARPATDSTGGA